MPIKHPRATLANPVPRVVVYERPLSRKSQARIMLRKRVLLKVLGIARQEIKLDKRQSA
jgi:hypothetical protein